MTEEKIVRQVLGSCYKGEVSIFKFIADSAMKKKCFNAFYITISYNLK